MPHGTAHVLTLMREPSTNTNGAANRGSAACASQTDRAASAPTPFRAFSFTRRSARTPTLPSSPPQLSPSAQTARAHDSTIRVLTIRKPAESTAVGIRFVRSDAGYERAFAPADGAVQPIVSAVDPEGAGSKAGVGLDDMVLLVDGQAGLRNTQVAALLRDLVGDIVVVVRKARLAGSTARAQHGRARMPSAACMPRLVI